MDIFFSCKVSLSVARIPTRRVLWIIFFIKFNIFSVPMSIILFDYITKLSKSYIENVIVSEIYTLCIKKYGKIPNIK